MVSLRLVYRSGGVIIRRPNGTLGVTIYTHTLEGERLIYFARVKSVQTCISFSDTLKGNSFKQTMTLRVYQHPPCLSERVGDPLMTCFQSGAGGFRI